MRAELPANFNGSVQTRENARSFLYRNGFLPKVPKEDPLSQQALGYALISLAHSASMKIIHKGTRALAILMMNEAA